MKNNLISLISIALFTLIPLASNSQEYPDCFRLDENGILTDLTSICGEGEESSLGSPSAVGGRFEVAIKRRESDIPVVEVIFNDGITFEMLFDTGATTISISPQMAVALKVKEEGKVPVSTAGGRIMAGKGRVKSVQVGNIVQKDLEVLITPALNLGLLGQSFFGDYDVTIKEDTIEFRPR